MSEALRIDRAATGFLIHAMQDWGDPEERKIASVQELLDVAGFKARATCWPIFGGIWKMPCEGRDAAEATEWLKQVTGTMVRGKAENEVEHIKVCVAAAARARETAT